SPFIPSATTLIYTLSLHDALPIFRIENVRPERDEKLSVPQTRRSESIKRHTRLPPPFPDSDSSRGETQPKGAGLFSTSLDCFYRSEEHTSELQSRFDLVCRLLLEK